MPALLAPLPVLLGELLLSVRLKLPRLLRNQPAYRLVGLATGADERAALAPQPRRALVRPGDQHLLSLKWRHRTLGFVIRADYVSAVLIPEQIAGTSKQSVARPIYAFPSFPPVIALRR